MDPKKASFGDIPPHWSLANLMENADIAITMQLLFGPILRKHVGCEYRPTELLL